MRKYSAYYSGYVYDTPKVNWSSTDEIKSKLQKISFDKKNSSGGGLPIISDGKTAYVDAGDSHTAIIAISGMKKSICGFMPLIYSLGKSGENMIITDPKGELFDRTSGGLVHEGYKILCLDFRTLDKDGFNIIEYPAYVYRNEDKDRGIMMANDLINVFAEKQKEGGKCDVFWPDTAAMYMAGTSAIMFDSYPDMKNINISNWAEFNTESGAEELKSLVDDITVSDTAIINLQSVLSEPERTLMSTLSTASSFLGTFLQNNKLARMLSHSTFSLEDLCKEKTALYIITDDTTTTCDTVVGIIISQIQSFLVHNAYCNKKKCLKTRVNFVLDEFTSYPIPNMQNSLATHRSRQIRYFLCIQSIAGLRYRYPQYEALLANCGNTLFLGSTEKELLDRISEQCGKTCVTPDQSERLMITPAELMALEKTWDYKEGIYLSLSDSIRYCTKLPSIEAYDIGNYKPPVISKEHPKVKRYTIDNLKKDIYYGKAKKPFSEDVKEPKKGVKKPKAPPKPVDSLVLDDSSDWLLHKFDELFGTDTTDENN